MKALLFLLMLLSGSFAVAGDCSLPNLNQCIQENIVKCPHAIFPDLRTPGLTMGMLRPSDINTIKCRMIIIN